MPSKKNYYDGLRVLRDDSETSSSRAVDPFAINLHYSRASGWTWLQAVLISSGAVYVSRALNVWSSAVGALCVAPILLISLPILARLKYSEEILKKIATRSAFLGVLFAISLPIALDGECGFWNFGAYFSALSFFHFSEFFVYSIANPRQCTLESFMLNHSTAYNIAAVASWIEYWLRFIIINVFLSDKEQNQQSSTASPSSVSDVIIFTGLACVLGGELLRKTAMLTASVSFTHHVEFRKREEHLLVTRGVYRLIRHPSYSGWLMWCVGTQLVLANPLCVLAYALVAVRFFHDRIGDEECYLIEFFGQDYVDYQRRTVTGVPFVYACQPTPEQCERLELLPNGRSTSKED